MKKGFLVIAMVGLLFALSISASAKVYYDEDFSDPDVLSDKTKVTFTVDKNIPEGKESYVAVVTEDMDVTGDGVPDGTAGTLRARNTKNSGTDLELVFQFGSEFQSNNGGGVLMFDFMLPNTSSYNTSTGASMIYFGGVRFNAYFRAGSFYSEGGTVITGHTAGQWYTYMFHLSKDKSVITVYRKLQSEPDTAFKKLGTNVPGSHTRAPSMVWTASNKMMDMFFDNVKVYNDANILLEEFTVDGETITEIGQVAEGELMANIAVLSNKTQEGLSKLFVAYDKSGKLLDCTVVEEETASIIMGHNNLSAVMNLDADTASAIADGGYVGLYVWNGMLPVMTPLELQ